MYIDSHCHLDFPELAQDLDAILARMRENQRRPRPVRQRALSKTFPQVLALATDHANSCMRRWAFIPITADCLEPDVPTLVRLAAHPRIIATGETGLDYFRAEGDPAQTHEWQRERFRVHIRAARQSGKPLIVHTRSASADTLAILKEEGEAACDRGRW